MSRVDDLLDPNRLHTTREGVEALLEHAEATGNKNLRVLCKIWLDPTSSKAQTYAEERIREFCTTGAVRL
jgi:hydroxypyruvate isomerase